MSIIKLTEHRVEKVWGRRDLPQMFGGDYSGAEPLGEIWFEHPAGQDVELLVKYLFTSEKLSIQVHPGDAGAKRIGKLRGKDEAWVVLNAEPDALIGIGLREVASRDELRQAALDGSIEQMLDWRPARAGDIYYSPAGTVHALGPGLTIIEIQQNVDLTFRLYDYGRARELHLDEGIEAAHPVPYEPPFDPRAVGEGREVLAAGGAFVLERLTGVAGVLAASAARSIWLVPIEGSGSMGGALIMPGTVWLITSPAELYLSESSRVLLAYPGDQLIGTLLR